MIIYVMFIIFDQNVIEIILDTGNVVMIEVWFYSPYIKASIPVLVIY